MRPFFCNFKQANTPHKDCSMTYRIKIMAVSLFVVVCLVVAILTSLSPRKDSVSISDNDHDPPEIKSDEELHRRRIEIFREWAPYLEEPGIEPQFYSVEGAFVSCVRAKDLKRALYWVPYLDYMESPEENNHAIGSAYEAVGDYETALEYYLKTPVIHFHLNRKLTRTYYFLGQYDKAADLLCDRIIHFGKYENPDARYGRNRYTQNNFKRFQSLFFENSYLITEPFATIDEIIAFLEEHKETLPNPERLDEVLNILNLLKPLERKMSP